MEEIIDIIIELFRNNIFESLFIAFILFITTYLWKKYWGKKPRISIHIPEVLPSQRRFGDHTPDFNFEWKPQVVLNNNSNFNAYSLEIQFPKGFELNDGAPLKFQIPNHNRLEANSTLNFELVTRVVKPFEDIVHVTIENGVRIIHHGRKVSDPYEFFKPTKIKTIKIVLSFENELGKRFYLHYSRKSEKEKNKILLFKNPFF